MKQSFLKQVTLIDNIGSWNVDQVTDMSGMFDQCPVLIKILELG